MGPVSNLLIGSCVVCPPSSIDQDVVPLVEYSAGKKFLIIKSQVEAEMHT